MVREASFAIGLEVLVLVGSRSARLAEALAFRAVGPEWTDLGCFLVAAVVAAVVSKLAFYALTLPPEGLVESWGAWLTVLLVTVVESAFVAFAL